eukprot:CAMPEP_0172534122 /NCGR_PEP_ID=MMETSP1067-20121228/6604_1 /TAXON_ID=265564 ORGANISM="Thalassiosira punctigera, Strain Tpunct2005C2" /NCGR_SAMPLE_ID=MMETSP1067 /ASSEMBLY_ACC=CAM_ASM_000444 /LENGTH=31 /DNA_ID= /DNA_START= /DNA_END= /DNA_ORIENTATION=
MDFIFAASDSSVTPMVAVPLEIMPWPWADDP